MATLYDSTSPFTATGPKLALIYICLTVAAGILFPPALNCYLESIAAADSGNAIDLTFGSQHPLESSHHTVKPRSPEVIEPGVFDLQTSIVWSNTYNGRGKGYLIDAEDRLTNIALRTGVTDRLEFYSELSALWRGGGVLDSIIKEWDSSLGFPNRRRERAPDDRFRISGLNQDSTPFKISHTGYDFRALSSGLKFRFTKPDEAYQWAAVAEFETNLGLDGYGPTGIEPGLGLLGQYSSDALSLFWGAGLSILHDTLVDNVTYSKSIGTGFLALEYGFAEQWSAAISLIGSFKGVKSIRNYPDNEFYLDTALRWNSPGGYYLGLVVRENPFRPKDTTDISVGVSCGIRF